MLNEETSNIPLRLKVPLWLPSAFRLKLNSLIRHLRLRRPYDIWLLLTPPASSHTVAPLVLCLNHTDHFLVPGFSCALPGPKAFPPATPVLEIFLLLSHFTHPLNFSLSGRYHIFSLLWAFMHTWNALLGIFLSTICPSQPHPKYQANSCASFKSRLKWHLRPPLSPGGSWAMRLTEHLTLNPL